MAERFGQYGGQYIPDTLMPAVLDLEKANEFYKSDADCYCCYCQAKKAIMQSNRLLRR